MNTPTTGPNGTHLTKAEQEAIHKASVTINRQAMKIARLLGPKFTAPCIYSTIGWSGAYVELGAMNKKGFTRK